MEKKLIRPRKGRMLSGVCAAMANYWGLNVSLVRVGYVLASIFLAGFLGVFLYFILMFFIPEEPNRFLNRK